MSRNAKPWYNRERGWWMVYWNGRKVRLVQGKPDKPTEKLACDRLADLRYEARHNPAPDTAEPTVASIIEAYQESARRRLAKSTLEAARPYLQSFAEVHGWRKVKEASPDHLDSWLYSHPEWVSDWTKNLAVRQVQAAFNWAKGKARLIRQNPFQGFTHPVGLPRRDMTAHEFQRILRATPNRQHRKRPSPGARFRQVCVFLWRTGCRPGEAAQLKWSDIDLDQALIEFTRHKTVRTQRKPRPRIIPLDPVVVKLLIWIRRLDQPGEHVFLNHRKTPWNKNSLAQRVMRARREAGIADDAKLYGVRHAFGTRAIVNGVDIKTLAELMGHTTTRMTEHYLHLAGQLPHLAAAMLRANGRRQGA